MTVLAVLGASPGGVTRDKLTGLLWPDTPDQAARHALRDALYVLRGTLGEASIKRAGSLLRLDPEHVWTDLAALEDAVAAGDQETVVELYRGPFCDGFYSRHGVDFEHWVDATRARMANRYEEALLTLVEEAEGAEDRPSALGWWRRLVAHDPLNTRFTLGLAKTQAASGDHANAVELVRDHERLLQDELGIPPPPEILTFQEELAREAATPGAASTPSTRATRARAVVAADHHASGGRRVGGAEPTAAAVVPVAVEGGPDGGRRSRKRRGWIAALSALGLVLVWQLGATLSGPAEVRSDLVVVPALANRTGDTELDIFRTLGSDWIAHGIQRSGIADVVPPLRAERAWSGLTDIGASADPVRALARETGAGWVVHGAYYRVGDSIRFRVHVVDARSPSTPMSVASVVAPVATPLVGVSRLREQTLGALAASIHGIAWATPDMMGTPPSLAVYRSWRRGEEAVERGDWPDAQVHFRRAWSQDTTFLAPLIRSGWGHIVLGQSAAADSVIRIARRRQESLSPFESLQVSLFEGYREGDLPKAARACRALAAAWPTFSFCAGLTTFQLGELTEALDYFDGLDTRLVSESWHVLGRMYAARIHHLRGDFHMELETARETQRLHPGWLSPFEGEVRGLLSLGHLEQAEALVRNRIIESAPYPSVPPTRPNWSTSGSVLTYLALEARAHGYPEVYLDWIERAIEWHRARLADDPAMDPLPMVRALYNGERWEEARDLLLEAGGRATDTLEVTGLRAVLATRLDEWAEVERLDRALAAYDARDIMGANLVWRARLAALSGQQRRAVELLREAHANGWPFNIWHHIDLDLQGLRSFSPFQEFLRPVG